MRSAKRVIWCFLREKIVFSNGWMALDGWTREWELERQMPNERSRLSGVRGRCQAVGVFQGISLARMPPSHVDA